MSKPNAYVYVWTEAKYKSDVVDWARVNRLLRQHGLKPVVVAHPSQLKKVQDVVVLESDTALELQESLVTLIRDVEQRQDMVQQLVTTNNQLKDETDNLSFENKKLSNSKKDLEILLHSAQDKIQELEGERLRGVRRREESADLWGSMRLQLEQQCDHQQREIHSLKNRLGEVLLQNEKQGKMQREITKKYREELPKSHSYFDKKLLDIVDKYESHIHKLKEEIKHHRLEASECKDSYLSRSEIGDSVSRDSLLSYDNRGLSLEGSSGWRWHNYEWDSRDMAKKESREKDHKIKTLENDVEILKLELNSRPAMKDFREAQFTIKRLQKQLTKNKNLLEKHNRGIKMGEREIMEAEQNKEYIEDICDYLGVNLAKDALPALRLKIQPDKTHIHSQQILQQVVDIVNSPAALQLIPRKQKPGSKKHAVWCEKSHKQIIPALQSWLKHIAGLKHLQKSLNNLVATMFPGQPLLFPESPASGQPVSVSEMRAAVDTLATRTNKTVTSSSGLPAHQLQLMVAHFQSLFDVPRLDGVYTRMNDVYRQLGEAHNILHTLRELLSLDSNSSPTSIVNAVGKICKAHNNTTSQQLKQLLQMDDIDRVVSCLREYEEFFPAFHGMVKQLLAILDVQRMEQIVPAVRSIKLLSG